MPHQSPNLDLSDMSDLLEHDLLILTRPGEMGLILSEPNVVCSFYSPVRIANMALHIIAAGNMYKYAPHRSASVEFGATSTCNFFHSPLITMGPWIVSPPTSFIIPDLVSHCKFPLSYHPNGDKVAQQSVEWLDSNCPDLNAKQRRALRGLQAGELTAYCYHNAPAERLRVVSDFMNYLFHL